MAQDIDNLLDEELEEEESPQEEDKYSALAEQAEEELESAQEDEFSKKFRALAKKQEMKWETKQKSREKYAEFVSNANEFEKEFVELLNPEDSLKEMETKIKFIKEKASKIADSLKEKEEALTSQYGAPIKSTQPKPEDEFTGLFERVQKGDSQAAFEIFMKTPPKKERQL